MIWKKNQEPIIDICNFKKIYINQIQTIFGKNKEISIQFIGPIKNVNSIADRFRVFK